MVASSGVTVRGDTLYLAPVGHTSMEATSLSVIFWVFVVLLAGLFITSVVLVIKAIPSKKDTDDTRAKRHESGVLAIVFAVITVAVSIVIAINGGSRMLEPARNFSANQNALDHSYFLSEAFKNNGSLVDNIASKGYNGTIEYNYGNLHYKLTLDGNSVKGVARSADSDKWRVIHPTL